MKNYYKILGVIPTAEMIVIKAAYRALSQKYHPDKNRDEAEISKQKMQELNEAYSVLSDEIKKQLLENKNGATPSMSFYDLTMNAIDGTPFTFSNLKGKKILIVNTASDCGYTGQYEALEQLQQKYKDQLVVIGFPANDFKGQEKSDNQNIAAFCKKNYGVSFPLM